MIRLILSISVVFLLAFKMRSSEFNDVQMKKTDPDTIPKTAIKGSGFIGGDFTHFKGNLNVLYLNPKICVFGLNHESLPYTVFITPNFIKDSIPANILNNLYKAKELSLKPSFSEDTNSSFEHCRIPDWLTDFKELEVLKLDFVDLDELSKLKSLPIKKLMLERSKYSNQKRIQNIIENMESLNEVVYDSSMASVIKYMDQTRIKFSAF
jgi:hypothetical protein